MLGTLSMDILVEIKRLDRTSEAKKRRVERSKSKTFGFSFLVLVVGETFEKGSEN